MKNARSRNANRLVAVRLSFTEGGVNLTPPGSECSSHLFPAHFGQFKMRRPRSARHWASLHPQKHRTYILDTQLDIYDYSLHSYPEESLVHGHTQVCDSARCSLGFDDLRRFGQTLTPPLGHDGQQTRPTAPHQQGSQNNRLGTSDRYERES